MKSSLVLHQFAAILSLVGLLLLGGVAWLTPVARAQLNQVGCTNGVGSVTDLIDSIRFTNLSPNEDTLILGQDCVYTLDSRFDGSLNGLPVIQNDLIIEGNGATIRRRVARTATFRLFEVTSGAHLTLRNLTLQNGTLTDDRGGAVLTGLEALLTLENVTFLGNSALEGGAVYSAGPVTMQDSGFVGNNALEAGGGVFTVGPLTLMNTTLVNNKAVNGGGLYSTSQVGVTGGHFEDNQATTGRGGGMLIDNANITLVDAHMIGNSAGSDGGGLYISGELEAIDARIIDSYLANNRALGSQGGGAVMVTFAPLLVTNTAIISNTATSEGGGIGTADGVDLTVTGGQIARNSAAAGGGLEVDGALTMRDTTVMSNTAQLFGGGVSASTAVVENSRFENNKALTSSGGGIAVGNLTLRQTTFISNSARSGGGVFSRGQVIIDRNTFSRNQAIDGAALLLATLHDDNELVNNLWFDNKSQQSVIALFGSNLPGAKSGVRAVHNTVTGSTPINTAAYVVKNLSATFHNNIITNYDTGLVTAESGTITAEHNLFFSNTTNESGDIISSNNLEADPRFVDPTNGDFHLSEGSLAVDNGLDVGVTVDLDGGVRPQGQGFDIGAYEFGASPSTPTPTPESDPNPTPAPNPGEKGFIFLPIVVK